MKTTKLTTLVLALMVGVALTIPAVASAQSVEPDVDVVLLPGESYTFERAVETLRARDNPTPTGREVATDSQHRFPTQVDVGSGDRDESSSTIQSRSG